MVAIVVMFGSFFCPIGGALSDRIGGIRTLQALFGIVAASYFAAAFLPAGPAPADAGTAVVAGWSFANLPTQAITGLVLFSVGVLCLGIGRRL